MYLFYIIYFISCLYFFFYLTHTVFWISRFEMRYSENKNKLIKSITD